MKALGSILAVALVALSLSACAPTQALTQAQTPDRHLVVPGRSIGPFLLGVSIEQFKAKLGPPTSVHQLRFDWGEPMAHLWITDNIAILVFSYTDLNRKGKVYEILLPAVLKNPAVTAKNAQYRTAQNLGMGSHRTEIYQAYGNPQFSSGDWEYFQNGLVFGFSREVPDPDLAVGVGVFRPLAP